MNHVKVGGEGVGLSSRDDGRGGVEGDKGRDRVASASALHSSGLPLYALHIL